MNPECDNKVVDFGTSLKLDTGICDELEITKDWAVIPRPVRAAEATGRRNDCVLLSGDIHRNGALDDDNLIELVSSGVSRKHQWWFWRVLRNYVLDLDAPRRL